MNANFPAGAGKTAPELLASPAIDVLMMPDYRRDNPYQELLRLSLAEQGVRVTFPQGYRRGLPFARALASLPPSKNPRLLHLHWFNPYLRYDSTLGYGLQAARLLAEIKLMQARGIPVVWTVHNQASHEAKHPALEHWVNQQAARHANASIYHTQAALQRMRQHWGLEPHHPVVIPHGNYRGVYGQPLEREAARRLVGFDGDNSPVFLHFGQLRPYKGVENLVEAWLRFAPKPGTARLHIAGKPLDEAYGQLLRQKAEGCSTITFEFGRVPDERLNQLLSAADVFVLPFARVLTSGSLLLALSFGLPVIAPKLDSLAETVAEAGQLMYHPEQEKLEDKLAAALTADLGDIRRQANQVVRRYDWDIIAEKTAALYRNVLGL